MNEGATILGALAVFGFLTAGLGVFGVAALRFGVDSRRSSEDDRLGRPTTWL